MRITICFLFLLISFCSCDRKQENLIRKIESNYHGLNKFYDELDTFNDSICKIALDSAKISFSKKNFVLYSFAPNDSSWTTAQILKNTFTFSVLERPYKSDVFEFSFNEGMISEYQREFGFNPIDSMSTIYETLRKKGLVEIPERFGTRYSDLVNFYICNLEFPQDTSLRSIKSER